MSTADLPGLNAALNSLSALFLVSGYILIRRRQERAHRACMIGAFVTSSVFLTTYLIYHFLHGSTPFTGQGVLRTVYFSILISHTLLAVVVPPLALMTIWAALRDQHSPPPPRPLDTAHLALRLPHRRHRLLDALPALTRPRPGFADPFHALYFRFIFAYFQGVQSPCGKDGKTHSASSGTGVLRFSTPRFQPAPASQARGHPAPPRCPGRGVHRFQRGPP